MGKNKNVENLKDKAEGKINEKVGKAIGNEKMEMKGKVQSAKADAKHKIDKIEKSFKEK